MKVPLSDHFDGNRFFNPTLPKGFAPSRLDAIKMAREPHSQLCVPKTLSALMRCQNRLSWRNDWVALFIPCSRGRANQVEEPA